jgi:lactoylglutathione lyase
MKIAHIALWTMDIEKLRTFYETYFQAQSTPKYTNAKKQFQS